jgi:hypothetical protein
MFTLPAPAQDRKKPLGLMPRGSLQRIICRLPTCKTDSIPWRCAGMDDLLSIVVSFEIVIKFKSLIDGYLYSSQGPHV